MTRALDILLQHAELARDQALAAWQQAQARVHALQQQARQLQGYTAETAARDPAREGRSTSMDSLLGHRSFMQRLQQAVALQQAQVDYAQLQAQALQADLLAREMRVAQVQKLQSRRHQETLRQQDRQQQRLSDDAGQQRLHHSRAQAAQASNDAAAAQATVGAAVSHARQGAALYNPLQSGPAKQAARSAMPALAASTPTANSGSAAPCLHLQPSPVAQP